MGPCQGDPGIGRIGLSHRRALTSISRTDAIAGAVLALAITCALLFATVRLAHRSLWLDEAYSIYVSGGSIGSLLNYLTTDNGPPAYYMILHFWMAVFGSGETATRLLSGLFYLAGSASVFVLGKYLLGRHAALWCGVLYLASPIAVTQSQNVRMYSLLGLLVVVSTYCFFRLVRERGGLLNWGLAYVGVNALGTLTHYWFFFVLIAHGITALVLATRSGRVMVWLSILLSTAPFVALWSPVFLIQFNNESTYWFPRVGTARALWDTCCDFFGSRGVALIVLTIGASVAVGRKRLKTAGVFTDVRSDRTLLAIAMMLAITVLVPLGISRFKPIYCAGRYMMVALPTACLLIGGFLDRVGKKVILSGLCCALLVLASVRVYRDRTVVESRSDRITGNYLGSSARDGDVVVFTSLSRLPVEYYLRRAAVGKNVESLSFPADLGESPALLDPRRLSANEATIRGESKALVARLVGAVEDRVGVWVVAENGNLASEILCADFEKYESAVRVVPLAGFYHDEIRLYDDRRRGASSSEKLR